MSDSNYPLPPGRLVKIEQTASFATRAEITGIYPMNRPGHTDIDTDIAKAAITVDTDEKLWVSHLSFKTTTTGVVLICFDMASLTSALDIEAADHTADSFTVSGDVRIEFAPGRTFTVANSTSNDGDYRVLSSSYDSATDITTILVDTTLLAVTATETDGDITTTLSATNGSTIFHGDYNAKGGESLQWDNPQFMPRGELGQSISVLMAGVGYIHGQGFIVKEITRSTMAPQAR